MKSGRHSPSKIAPFSVCTENPDLTLSSKIFSIVFDGHFETIFVKQEFAVITNFLRRETVFKQAQLPRLFFVLSLPVLLGRIFCFNSSAAGSQEFAESYSAAKNRETVAFSVSACVPNRFGPDSLKSQGSSEFLVEQSRSAAAKIGLKKSPALRIHPGGTHIFFSADELDPVSPIIKAP